MLKRVGVLVKVPVLVFRSCVLKEAYWFYLYLRNVSLVLVEEIAYELKVSCLLNPFSTGMHFYIYSAYYWSILCSFRNSCGD